MSIKQRLGLVALLMLLPEVCVDRPEGQELVGVLRQASAVGAMAFSPDGVLASASYDTVRLWDVRQQRQVGVLAVVDTPYVWLNGAIWSVAFSPDGKLLASGGMNTGSGLEYSQLFLWDVEQRTLLASLPHPPPMVTSVAFSPDGQFLASGGWWDRTVRLWDVAQRQEVLVLQYLGEVYSVAFSPDGSLLAVSDGLVHLWNVAKRTEVAVLEQPAAVSSMAFSSDGRLLALGSWECIDRVCRSTVGTVHLWDVAQRTEVAVLRGHTSRVPSVAFSPDGALLASASEDSTVRLWDVAQSTEVIVLRHPSAVFSVAFSPDGTLLASGDSHRDNAIYLWGVIPTAVESHEFDALPSVRPLRTALLPAYPNPGNPEVWIPYELSREAEVSIQISTVTGQIVRALTLGHKPAGRCLSREQAAYWDCRTAEGEEVASGVYYSTLHAGAFIVTRSLVVLK